ncbi:MAG: response regulator transcription factor [Streptococcaceae bacterium]|jgi:DNA-binding response OmpR family regulator|nr:response regulator transcription factor [Streptococcaceae bacterium]
MKILVADDTEEIVELLAVYLTNEGYVPVKASNGEEALAKFYADKDIALIVLDIMMPDIDGMHVIKEIRKSSNIPVIFLTAKNEDMDKIKGLVAGADDYVTKPFNGLEIMARIKTILKRTNQKQEVEEVGELVVGSLTINKDSHTVVTDSGENIQLTALEFGILYLLATNLGKVFSAEEIFEKVWRQENVVSAKTVMVHVSHLRDKILDATNGEKVIQTVWGVGYKIDNH